MYKNLLRDASLYSLSSFVARGFSIITVPLFTRVLSPQDYGALDLLSMLCLVTALLVGLALDQAVSRFYMDSEDDLERKRIASTTLFYSLFVFLALIPAALLLAEWVADVWLEGQVNQRTVLMVFAYIWVHSIFVVTTNQLRYLFQAKKYAFCQIGNVLISTGLSVLLVFYLQWGVIGVFIAQAIGQGTFGLVALFLARSSYALMFHWPTFQRMLRYSLPLVPGTLSFYGMQYLDRVFLNELRTLGEVGIYSIGARLASLVNLFLMGFHAAWAPVIFKTFRDEGATQKFSNVFNHYLFATLMILTTLSLFGEEILLLLTTEQFSPGYVVVPLLVGSAILASIAGYFTFGIQIKEKSSYRLAINIMAVFVNCGLNVLLIPRFGIVGAALATALSYGTLAAVGMAISQRLYFVGYAWRRIWLAGFIAAAVSGGFVYFDLSVSLGLILIKILVCGLLGVFLMRVLGVRIPQLLGKKGLSEMIGNPD